MISATVGVTSLVWAGFAAASPYGAIWTTWWLGDATGALVVAPALLLWSSWSSTRWKKRQIAEAIVLLLGLALVTGFVFGGLSPSKVETIRWSSSVSRCSSGRRSDSARARRPRAPS